MAEAMVRRVLRGGLAGRAHSAHWRRVHRHFPSYRVAPFTLHVFDASVGYSLNSPEALVADGVEGRRVLDVGVGNGIITLFARHWGAGSVVAVDVNPRAVDNARFNVDQNDVDRSGVEIRHGDLYDGVTGLFDLIVCNPPYYRFETKGGASARTSDPHLVPRLVAGARAHLAPGGVLRLLYPRRDRGFIEDLAQQHGLALHSRDHRPASSPQLDALRLLLRGPYRRRLHLHELRPR